MKYRLRATAKRDLATIASFGSAQFGDEVAAKYLEGLFRTFSLIGDNPEIARVRREMRRPIRIHPYRRHVIVYRIDDRGFVDILRVRHARENWLDDES